MTTTGWIFEHAHTAGEVSMPSLFFSTKRESAYGEQNTAAPCPGVLASLGQYNGKGNTSWSTEIQKQPL